MDCPECGAKMNKSHGRQHTQFICPECGHEVRKEVGKKKFFGIRLYDYQKHNADKRGGIQAVVDLVLDDE